MDTAPDMGPLPDVGPNPAGSKQDGSQPGCCYAGGVWQIVNGVNTLVVPPRGFSFPPNDGH